MFCSSVWAFHSYHIHTNTPTIEYDDDDHQALHAAGFVGVRFNAANFPGGVTSADGALNPTAGGLTSDVGQALYKRAGELGMPVGLMAFKGLAPFAVQVRALCQQYPDTILIIDHLGFFRQPAIGGQLGNKVPLPALLSLTPSPHPPLPPLPLPPRFPSSSPPLALPLSHSPPSPRQ